MPSTLSHRITPTSTSTSTSDVSPPATFTGYRRTKATNSTRSQLTKSVTFSPLSARHNTATNATATAASVSSAPYSLPSKYTTKRTKGTIKRTINITKPKAIIPSSSSSPSSSSPSSSISRCARCRGTDHQRSTSRRCPYFKGKQTTGARINNTQKPYSYNVDYYEAIFDTVPDDDVLAALAEVDQDQDPNMTSQSTIVVDDDEDSEDNPLIIVQDQDPNATSQSTIVVDDYEDSEDEPLIRRRAGWKSVYSSEPIQFDDEGDDNLQTPLPVMQYFKHYVGRVDPHNTLHQGFYFWMHGHPVLEN
ncbi:hypothetical protein BGX24_001989 [Mortierella sp. AD032]|nr:hypothetical protein BGX24_001989 [Mortierella sp. AD032]